MSITPEKRARIKELMMVESYHWGPLHIIVEDGNLDDHNVAACEGDDVVGEERELLDLLKSASEDERYDIWDELYPWENA